MDNDQKGIARVRGARRQEYEQEEEQEEEQAPAKPVAPSSSITASIDDTATSSIGNTATGSTGFYGAPLRTSQVGLYHPDSVAVLIVFYSDFLFLRICLFLSEMFSPFAAFGGRCVMLFPSSDMSVFDPARVYFAARLCARVCEHLLKMDSPHG